MFDVGFTEIMLIGVVALVVIGPERLPAVARTVGQYVGKLQRFVTGVKRDIRNELESGELKDLIGDQKAQIDELRKMVNTTRRDLEADTRDAVRGAKRTFAELEREARADEVAPGADVPADPPAGAPSLVKDDPAPATAAPPLAPGSADASVAAPAPASPAEAVPAGAGGAGPGGISPPAAGRATDASDAHATDSRANG